MSRISITGSDGFLGGIMAKLMGVPARNCYDIKSGRDITDHAIQTTLTTSSDAIIHLAAISGIKACEENRTYSELLNVTTTVNLAERSKEAGAERFLFASSSAVYGEACSYSMCEEHPVDPRSFYGDTKLRAEQILGLADRRFKVIVFRQSNLYGYGTIRKGITVLDKFLDAFVKHEPMTITGSGAQKRDFVHVMDVARVYAKVSQARKVRSGIYNLGGKESISIRALAEMVNSIGEAILGYRVPIEYKPANDEALWHDFQYDSSKARLEFQYEPIFTLDDFIKEALMLHLRERTIA